MTTKKPISPDRLAANRANAAKSTGPRTQEGKTRSARNSRKHGFTADIFAVVRLEETGALADLRADLVSVYQPVNAQELFALEHLALAQQTLLRVARLESGLLTACLNKVISPEGESICTLEPDLTRGIEVTLAQNRAYLLAEGFIAQTSKSNAFPLFFRYWTLAERMYRRSLEQFEALKAKRPELPNEPIEEPEPAPVQPVAAPPANPSDSPKPPFVPLKRPIPADPTIAVTSPYPPGYFERLKNRGQ